MKVLLVGHVYDISRIMTIIKCYNGAFREASGAGGGAGSGGLLAMNATQVQCEPHDSVVLIKCK